MPSPLSRHRQPPALPAVKDGADLTRLGGIAAEAEQLYRALANGHIDAPTGRMRLAFLTQMARLVQAAEMEARIATLEAILNDRKKPK